MKNKHEITGPGIPREHVEFFKEVADWPLKLARLFPKHFYVPFARMHQEISISFTRGKKLITLVEIPRGAGKTTLALYIFVLFLGIWMKVDYIVVLEEVKEKANMSAMSFRDALTETPEFLKVFGNVRGKPWSNEYVNVKSEKFGFNFIVGFKSIDGALRGLLFKHARPQFILLNDIEDIENKDFPDPDKIKMKVDKIQNIVIPALQIKDNRGRPGRIGWLATTVGSDCVCMRAERWENVHVIKYPALVEVDGLNGKEEKSTWEEMMSTSFLKKKREWFFSQNNPAGWFSEYQNDPRTANRLNFKSVSCFNIEDLKVKTIKIKMAIDASYSVKKSADSTGVTVGGYASDGHFYILKSIEGKFEPEVLYKLMNEIILYCAGIGFPVDSIYIEATAFGFVEYGWRHSGYGDVFNGLISQAVHPRSAKADRVIKHLIKLDGSNKLHILPGECETLKTQMERFPYNMSSWGCIDSAAQLVSVCFAPVQPLPDREMVIPGSPMMYIRKAERSHLMDMQPVEEMYSILDSFCDVAGGIAQ